METKLKSRLAKREVIRKGFLVAIAVLIGAWVLMGYTGTTAVAVETQGVTKDTIKIGTFGPFTGRAATFGKIDHSAQIVYKGVNEEGGILGRKLEIITEDEGCDPKMAIAAVKKLIYDEKVFFLHGGSCSNAVAAVKEEIVRTGIPFMLGGATLGSLTVPVEKNIYSSIQSSDEISDSIVDFLLSKPGIKRIGIVKHNDPWGMALYTPAIQKLKERGFTPVIDVDLASGATTAVPQLLQIKNANPEVIILYTYPTETTVFLKDMNKLGLAYPCIGRHSPITQSEKAGGYEVAKYYLANTDYSVPFDHPNFKKWISLLNKYYPKDEVDSTAFLCTGGALAVTEVLKRASKDLTWGNVIKELDNLKNFNTGITYPLTYSPTDHRGLKKGGTEGIIEKDKQVMQIVVSDWQNLVSLRPDFK
jgi:branched-chain amino acid transport system substrate-binding protein